MSIQNTLILLGLFAGWPLAWAILRAVGRRASRAVRLTVARAAGGMRPFRGRAFVIDGDTIVVARRRVRLFGMDAPELSQHGGPAARAHLVRLIGGRGVEVIPVDTDRYGRIVARVRGGDGTDLSRAMVRDGFARALAFWSWAHLLAEAAARLRRRGLWSACPLRGIGSPYRHRRRGVPR